MRKDDKHEADVMIIRGAWDIIAESDRTIILLLLWHGQKVIANYVASIIDG